jgi:hypothetical protein
VATAQQWITLGWERFAGDLGDRVRAASLEEIKWDGPSAFPLKAGVLVESGDGQQWLRTYSPESWARFLDLLRSLPETAAVEAGTRRFERSGGASYFQVGLHRYRGADGSLWFDLFASVHPSVMAESMGEAVLLDTLRQVADMSNPTAGFVFRHGQMGPPLEAALYLRPDRTVPRSREVLRDYGWVTAVPQQLGDRLGGLRSLQASGAFHDVAQLTAGGYWLQATPRWDDYGIEQAEAIFKVLAPILPVGRPDVARAAPNVLVSRDASSPSDLMD